MSTKTKASKFNKLQFILWGAAILSVVILIFVLGWKWFYGFVIPQTSKVGTLPLTGVVGFSLVAGALSFFAPCPFAVFPAYAAFFLAEGDSKNRKGKALRFSLSASLAVIIFYVVLGLVLAAAGTQLAFYTNYLKLGVIFLIFVFGLVLITGRQLPTGIIDSLTGRLSQKTKGLGAFGYGIIYAIAGAACFLPVILTISLIPILAGKFLSGFLAFVAYGLAISAMLTLATFILASGKEKLLKSLASKGEAIKKISGAILVATALFLVLFYIQTGM